MLVRLGSHFGEGLLKLNLLNFAVKTLLMRKLHRVIVWFRSGGKGTTDT